MSDSRISESDRAIDRMTSAQAHARAVAADRAIAGMARLTRVAAARGGAQLPGPAVRAWLRAQQAIKDTFLR